MRPGSEARRWLGWWTAATVAASFAVAGAVAQQPAPPDFPAVQRWLATDQSERNGLEVAVRELLADVPAGMAWLGAELQRDAGRDRRKGLESLVSNVTLEFLHRQQQSGVRFAGQFQPLRPLQPLVNEFLFVLLLDTPQWYPTSHRDRLVPALCDLQPTSPGEPLIGRVLTLVENREIEPEPLRQALACLLWQWGKKQYAQERLDALLQESGEGDVEDRVRVMLQLTELQYELREYRSAAATHRALQAMAKGAALSLKPLDWYQSACCHALAGDPDRAFESLQCCAELQAAATVDSSLKLERRLFETDPEIESLRRDARFAAILEQAFPGEPEPKNGR